METSIAHIDRLFDDSHIKDVGGFCHGCKTSLVALPFGAFMMISVADGINLMLTSVI